MKIKLSKSQWELVGKKAGWMKNSSKNSVCQKCGFQFNIEETKKGNKATCPKCKTQYEFRSSLIINK